MMWGLVILIAAILVTTVVLGLGRWRWQRATADLHKKMQSERLQASTTLYDAREIQTLPPAVKRYFETALRDGQGIILSVRLSQQGLFRMNLKKNTWQMFEANQFATMQPSGFDWDARIKLAPGIAIWVRDAYASGVGFLRAAIFGVFTVAEMRGTVDSAHGELLRYLAESAWYPTALLPSQGVQWRAVDEYGAEATLCDGKTQVTMLFTFGADNLITTVWAASRVRSETESSPWLCRLKNYELRSGMLVPGEGEVEWQLPDGPAAYFRACVANIEYEFAGERLR